MLQLGRRWPQPAWATSSGAPPSGRKWRGGSDGQPRPPIAAAAPSSSSFVPTPVTSGSRSLSLLPLPSGPRLFLRVLRSSLRLLRALHSFIHSLARSFVFHSSRAASSHPPSPPPPFQGSTFVWVRKDGGGGEREREGGRKTRDVGSSTFIGGHARGPRQDLSVAGFSGAFFRARMPGWVQEDRASRAGSDASLDRPSRKRHPCCKI